MEDDLPKEASDMAMVKYLQAARMSTEEWTAFRAKYDLDSISVPFSQLVEAEDAYDAHTHHTEHGGSHH